jgi:hypothetical protein
VVLLVVMVRLGFAGVVTEAGLMTQMGVPVVCSGVTWQLRSTFTGLGELRALTLMVEVAACPPGKTAAGDTGEAPRVKSCACAKAADSSVKTVTDKNAIERGRVACRDFNMRKLWFNRFDSQGRAKAARRRDTGSIAGRPSSFEFFGRERRNLFYCIDSLTSGVNLDLSASMEADNLANKDVRPPLKTKSRPRLRDE